MPGVSRLQGTLLACYAHPDDESYGAAGAIAKYAAEDVKCFIVTATSGESGLDYRNRKNAPLGEHRATELARAALMLGAQPPLILGFPDGEVKEHIEEVAAGYLELFRDLKPEVVLTFDKTGVTGHSDHIGVHRAVTDAFAEWGAKSSRLFYSLLPRTQISIWKLALETNGLPELVPEFPDWDSSPVPPDGSGGPRLVPDEWITTTLAVDGIVKRNAIRCHESQLGPSAVFASMPDKIASVALGTEFYMLAGGNSDGITDDLFGRSPI